MLAFPGVVFVGLNKKRHVCLATLPNHGGPSIDIGTLEEGEGESCSAALSLASVALPAHDSYDIPPPKSRMATAQSMPCIYTTLL